MLAKKVSSGRVIISASMRGTTSMSTGSRPSVRIASTSSLMVMAPISAVKALPDRPATMIAVSRIPISRSTPTPTRLTVKISAPN